jgi:hypothetical protein
MRFVAVIRFVAAARAVAATRVAASMRVVADVLTRMRFAELMRVVTGVRPGMRCSTPLGLVADQRVVALMLVVGCALCPTSAVAQVRAGAAVGISTQHAGDNDLPRLGLPFGGTSTAIVGSLDRPFKGRLTIGGELSTATAISGDQSERTATATNAFVSRHRDTVISATAKYNVGLPSRFRAAAVGGLGGGYRRTSREGTTASLQPPASRTPFSETVSNLVLAYTLGADVSFGISERLSILAVGRWHRLRDDDRLDSGAVRRGVASTVYRVGIGAQWTLR